MVAGRTLMAPDGALPVERHVTSMAVWDAPSPAVCGRPFALKVGVKCSAGCRLTGHLVEVRDEAGAVVGGGQLGDTAWPGTDALYVADLRLTASPAQGPASWSARLVVEESGQHDESSAAFGFTVDGIPEHRVAVQVSERDTHAPLEGVDVRLGVYRASTGADGAAAFELPGGTYALAAWKDGYTTDPRTVEVHTDLVIQLNAVAAPDADPDDERLWM